MENYLSSIYSDGSRLYVSSLSPALGETVTIRISMRVGTPIRYVCLWSRQNGAQRVDDMVPDEVRGGLQYYKIQMTVADPRMEYRFYLVGEERNYYYTQRGLTTYMPDHSCNFVLLAQYHQPEWVKNAVFYQIFPERFCNGNPDNDVKTGEYEYHGHSPIHMENWESEPLPYEQGFCMDFFGGDLEGIREKIPYLKKLGVTALYINPIFAGPSTHKYDCIDYFHVDPHFGGDQALADLSKALHENGMKIILDISINHTGTANRWFNRDGLFFDRSEGAYNNPDSLERNYYFFEPGTDKYKGWWDIDTLPVLNYGSEELRDEIYRKPDSVLRKWLRPPYSIDGWRFDVADVMGRNGAYQFADEIWPEICAAIRKENPEAYILAEDWDECSERQQGDEWDAPMNYYSCGRVIRGFYGQRDYYYRQNEVMREHAHALRAEDIKEQILGYLGKLPFVMQLNQFNLIDSHDIPRLHNDANISKEDLLGAAIMQFTLPGTPSVYYGDEAEIGGWEKTLEGCRFPMPWSKNIEGTDAYKVYAKLAHLKQESETLAEGGLRFLYAYEHVIAYARTGEQETYITIASSDDREMEITLALQDLGIEQDRTFSTVMGEVIEAKRNDDGSLTVRLNPHQAALVRF